MGYRRHVFAPEEWYHCYNRGVDKRKVFENRRDYDRFLETLYLCNDTETFHRDNLRNKSHTEIFEIPRRKELVHIGTYCLMPNHFHLLLQERVPNGIIKFMHKLGTAYTMYFNVRRERVGGLFVKPFRSRHVAEEFYFRHVAQYIHLNPVELYEPGWKSGMVNDYAAIESRLKRYAFSSLLDYENHNRPERAILSTEAFDLIREELPPLHKTLANAAAYYRELEL